MNHKPTEIPRQCPVCGSTRIAKVIYGFWNPSEETVKDVREGRVVSGGCVIKEDEDGNTLSPQWRCLVCHPSPLEGLFEKLQSQK